MLIKTSARRVPDGRDRTGGPGLRAGLVSLSVIAAVAGSARAQDADPDPVNAALEAVAAIVETIALPEDAEEVGDDALSRSIEDALGEARAVPPVVDPQVTTVRHTTLERVEELLESISGRLAGDEVDMASLRADLETLDEALDEASE